MNLNQTVLQPRCVQINNVFYCDTNQIQQQHSPNTVLPKFALIIRHLPVYHLFQSFLPINNPALINIKFVGRHKQKDCRGFTVSLQHALKVLQRELFHATLTHLRSSGNSGRSAPPLPSHPRLFPFPSPPSLFLRPPLRSRPP